MEVLTCNLSGSVRYETLRGRKYLVAPMSLIAPGVLNGSKGALYYPPAEVENSVEAWNHTPIVVYHPTQNGQAISARDPSVLDRQGIGFVFNAKYNGKLIAEGWFDVEDTQRVDNRILENLEAGKTIELSTGLFTDNEIAPEGAVHNGKTYAFIARNYRPDHLAILPDQIGACSIKDGCGVLVNQKGDPINFVLTENEMSHDELHSLLTKGLKSRFTQDEPSAWISDVYDSYIVYWQGDDLYKLSYTKADGVVTLGSESPVKVIRETTFVVANSKETLKMASEKLVNQLIANCSCWDESDREVLNKMDDAKVQKMITAAESSKNAQVIANKALEGFEDEQGGLHAFNQKTGQWEHAKKEEPVDNKKKEEPAKPMTDEAWLASAPAGIRSVVQNAMAAEAKRRNALYERIVANEESDEAKKALHETLNLNAMSEEGLEALAKRMEAKAVASNPVSLPSYFGRSGGAVAPTQNKEAEKVEPLLLPKIDWSKN